MLNNNVNLPKHLYAYLRTEFCNNLEPGTEGFIPCVVFGAESNLNRALGFHVLREDGALVSQVPLHALCWIEGAPRQELFDLCEWDCFGHWLSVIEFSYLADAPVDCLNLQDEQMDGAYVCTFDFLDNGFSNCPSQHKCLHLIRLDSGNFALKPNNRCRFQDLSFTRNIFAWSEPPKIKTNRILWRSEEEPEATVLP